MTDAEFAQLLVLLDSLWGGVDEVYGAGYRHLLGDFPYELVEEAVDELARGVGRPLSELKWLPKPPVLFASADRIRGRRELIVRAFANAERMLQETNPLTQEDRNDDREGEVRA